MIGGNTPMTSAGGFSIINYVSINTSVRSNVVLVNVVILMMEDVVSSKSLTNLNFDVVSAESQRMHEN